MCIKEERLKEILKPRQYKEIMKGQTMRLFEDRTSGIYEHDFLRFKSSITLFMNLYNCLFSKYMLIKNRFLISPNNNTFTSTHNIFKAILI